MSLETPALPPNYFFRVCPPDYVRDIHVELRKSKQSFWARKSQLIDGAWVFASTRALKPDITLEEHIHQAMLMLAERLKIRTNWQQRVSRLVGDYPPKKLP